jgi:hypothetical protein
MRRRIDMTEVEAATKIRAKYLRALENEEWDLLPGPTFVKTFLRTYAEYLDLDPRLLVEEYRQRYERPSTQELTPFGPGRGGRRRQRPRRHWGPGIVIGIGVVALVAALYGLSLLGQDNEPESPVVGTPTATTTPKKKAAAPKHHRKPAKPTRVSLRLSASAPVYVCLENASGHPVLNGVTMSAGQRSATFHSKRFRANLGNGNVRFRVNGHSYRAADTGNPVGYEFRPTGRPRRLSEAARVQLCRS